MEYQLQEIFLKSAEEWACDGYTASLRFIAGVMETEALLWDAVVLLSPLPPEADNSFKIKTNKIIVGQVNLELVSEQEFLKIIQDAISGIIVMPKLKLRLDKASNYSYYSKTKNRDLWYYGLHLAISGTKNHSPTVDEIFEIDNDLRKSVPPFDGLDDAYQWLGLINTDRFGSNASIDVFVSPPVDLVYERTSLSNDILQITLHAHAQFSVSSVQVAIKAIPGDNLNTRLQIASKITWEEDKNKLQYGTASVSVKNADNVLIMLLIGDTIVRRQWIIDPSKAGNNRLIAIQSFDKDLKRIKDAVQVTADSTKFEHGVAALLFLLGFAPCVQIETDSPDIIVQTPNGRIVLIECTLRIADFHSKIGKLVDRRGRLARELERSGHAHSIASVLICRLARDRVAAHAKDLVSHKTILITEEELSDFFEKVRYHNNPDKLIEDAERELINDSQMNLGLR